MEKLLKNGWLASKSISSLKLFFSFVTIFIGVILIGANIAVADVSTSAPSPGDTIRSGAEIDYPPFSIVGKNGEAGGFSVELLRATLRAMGREVAFRTGPWKEVRGWLERGEIDALPLVGRTPEREALFDFTVPYMSLYGAIVVRSDETGVRDLADLRGRRVAVMKGDNAEEFLRREQRDFEIHTTPTFDLAFQDLAEGRNDAVVVQRLVALRLIQKTGLTDLKVIDRPIDGFRQDFCFAVTEGDRATLALLNEGLSIVVADGTYRHLHAKWFAAMQLPTDRPIVVGGDRNYPPFEFLDENGRPSGFNVDLTRAIAREMGLNVDIQLGDWPERMESLQTGKIDVLQGMFYSPARDLNFDFSQAHSVSNYVAVVRKGEGPAPERIDGLGDRRLVVERGDIIHDYVLENGLEKQVAFVEDQEAALQELAQGRHDCALVSRVAALSLIQKHGWTNLELGRKPILAADYGYAVANGQKALLAQFGEGLKALENNGEYRRIYDKWLGVYQEEPVTILTALRYASLVIIPLLVILLVAFVWSWTLRRQVAEKTKALQESLDRFRYVFEAANVGKSMTLTTGEVNANQAFADFLGYALDELQGKRWQDITPTEDIDATEQVLAPMLTGQKDAARFEKRYIHKNGEWLWADVSVSMRRDADGAPLYFMTTVVDITARKQAEAALRTSEEHQRAMITCSPVALYSVDLDGNVLSWNTSAERIFGWRAEDIMGQPLPIVPDDKHGEFDALRRQVLENGGFFGKELMRLRNDGALFPVSLSAAPVRNDRGEIVGILGATEDITERKRYQQRIEHLNQVLRAIRDVNQLIVRARDPDRLIRDGCRLLVGSRGYPSALIVLTDDRDRPVTWAMEGLAANLEELAALLEQGALPVCCGHAHAAQEVLLVDDRGRVCDGCPRAETSAESQSLCASLTHEGETFGYLVAATENHLIVDEEERGLFAEMAGDFAYALSVMRIEAAHRESESRFRSIVENAPEPIFIQTEMRFAYLNPKALDLFGVKDARELLGTPVMERFHPDYHEQIKNRIKRLNEDRQPVSELLEVQFQRLDGSTVWVETTGQPIVYEGKSGALVFVRDTTARKRNEQEREKLQGQLIQAQKMESVGRLAGGVAHDFNNMLGAILGYTEMAMERVEPEEPLHVDLVNIHEAAQRSADLTRQLLAFARQQAVSPKVIDLNDTIENMLKLLRRLIGEDIDLAWRPGREVSPIKMDPAQIDQILANLCVNARDAIAGAGKITIETGNTIFDEDHCKTHPGVVPGEYAILAVSDNGCGMAKETQAHLFEPFFTTKDIGKGTGLGLATVYGIIKQNHGFISVYSEPGQGTTLKIYLPRYAVKSDRAVKKKAGKPNATGLETILLVEDEPLILDMTVAMLELLGYTVLPAATPGEATRLAQEYSGTIDLLITDVIMPEMNGLELAEKLESLRPGLKRLFMSGYTANVIARHGVLDEGVHFLQKPFLSNNLATKVREALAAGKGGRNSS